MNKPIVCWEVKKKHRQRENNYALKEKKSFVGFAPDKVVSLFNAICPLLFVLPSFNEWKGPEHSND